MSKPSIKKLDPSLRSLLRDLAAAGTAPRSAGGEAAPCFPESVRILVEFRGARADLEAVGVRFINLNPHPDGTYIGVATVPLAKLPALADIEHVVAVDGGGQYQPELNYSVAEINARSLQSGASPLTGQGVIVGIIDSGLDWRHGAFRHPDGKSRILAIWDQSLTAEAGETKGLGDIGVVYAKDKLDEALADEAKLKTVRTDDDERPNGSGGHGTHVAGIAAGDGSPGDCCAKGGTYVGVAPRADIVAVRLSSAAEALGDSTNLALALQFIFDQATVDPSDPAKDKAVVINISLGDNLGAHDGTSLVEREIDRLVRQRAGRAVVKSAGNEGGQNHHVRVAVPQTTAERPHEEIAFTVGETRSTQHLDLWYENGHELSLEVIAPDGGSSQVLAHGTDKIYPWNPTAPVAKQGRVDVDWTLNAPHNNDHNVRIQLRAAPKGTLPKGEWKLRVSNAKPAAVELHAWLQRGQHASFLPPDAGSTRIRASNDSTISIPGTAREVIAVANWVGRASVLDCCPDRDIADSSSRGPVRKNDPDNLKPTVAAPGTAITSAQADSCQLPGNACDCCPERCCSLYEVLGGTSMAAPHIAGAIALMFEVDKTLTRGTIVQFLEASATRPVGADQNAWGAGTVDVVKAIAMVRAALPPPPPGPSPRRRAVSRVRPAPRPRLAAATSAAAATSTNPMTGTGRIIAPGLPGLSALLPLVRGQLAALPQAEPFLALVSRHFSEVRRLVNTNRKVATLWHRGEGPALLRRLVAGATHPGAPAPLRSREQRVYLERMFQQLGRFGSPRLRAALEGHQAELLDLLARPLPVLLPALHPALHPASAPTGAAEVRT